MPLPSFFGFKLIATEECVDRCFLYLIFEDSQGRCVAKRVNKKEAYSE